MENNRTGIQPYIVDFFKSRNSTRPGGIRCELCRYEKGLGYKIKFAVAVDVHHISKKFGGKRVHSKDGTDLIALCRRHHRLVHENKYSREDLMEIVKKILDRQNRFKF